jgi:hypothetical protein
MHSSYPDVEMPDEMRRELARLDAETVTTENGWFRLASEQVNERSFINAALVCPYFAMENETARTPVKWRIPRRGPIARRIGNRIVLGNRVTRLRVRLRKAQADAGVSVVETITERPNAGQPVFGPLPLPAYRPKVDLSCHGQHSVKADFVMPDDAYTRNGYTWHFRAEFHRRILAKGGK